MYEQTEAGVDDSTQEGATRELEQDKAAEYATIDKALSWALHGALIANVSRFTSKQPISCCSGKNWPVKRINSIGAEPD